MLSASPQIHTPADEPVDQSVLDREARSVGHMFRDRINASPDRPAYLHAVVTDSGDQWVTVTWAELDVVVREIGAGLIALGIEPEDRVAHRLQHPLRVGRWPTSPSWSPAAPPPPSTRRRWPTTSSFIVSDSGAKVVFAENADAAREAARHPGRDPRACCGSSSSTGCPTPTPGRSPSTRCASSAASTSRATPARSTRASTASRHDQLATIIYTSGTTGRPKGVRLRAQRLDLRGRRRRRDQHPQRGRPAVPLAAAGPRLRQGAAHPAAADRLPHGHRRPDRQDRRQPRGREADLHGRRPAHLREGLRPDQMMMADEGGVEGEALRLGDAASAARSAALREQGKSPAGLLAAQVRPRRQAGLHQDPRALRRTDPLLHLRLRRAQPGRRALVRRRGACTSSRATA